MGKLHAETELLAFRPGWIHNFDNKSPLLKPPSMLLGLRSLNRVPYSPRCIDPRLQCCDTKRESFDELI